MSSQAAPPPGQSADHPIIAKIDRVCLELAALAGEQREALARASRPVERRTVTLTSSAPVAHDQAARTAPSLTVANYGAVTVWVGVGSELPRADSGAVPVPAGAVVTIPVAVRSVQLGVDPSDDIPAGGVPVEIYRYWTVQAAASSSASAAASVAAATTPGARVAVATASGQILAANPARRYVSVSNVEGPGDVFLSLGGAAAVNAGITLPVGSSWEMPAAAIYSGAINAIASSAGYVAITEY